MTYIIITNDLCQILIYYKKYRFTGSFFFEEL